VNDSETSTEKLVEIANATLVSRFMVRQGQHGLMVWDRQAKGPATFNGRLAIGLSEDKAADIKNQLTHFYAPDMRSSFRDR
jgi:hypothetical protein